LYGFRRLDSAEFSDVPHACSHITFCLDDTPELPNAVRERIRSHENNVATVVAESLLFGINPDLCFCYSFARRLVCMEVARLVNLTAIMDNLAATALFEISGLIAEAAMRRK